MHVLLLSTEYAARGAGRPAFEVARALVRAGVEVTVVTHGETGPGHLEGDAARVVWAGDQPPMIPGWDVLPWTLQANSSLAAATTFLDPVPDIVHALDWNVVWAAMAARDLYGIPLVASGRPPVVHPEAPETHRDAIGRAHAWLAAEAVARIELPHRWFGSRRSFARNAMKVYEQASSRAPTRRARSTVRSREDAAAELA